MASTEPTPDPRADALQALDTARRRREKAEREEEAAVVRAREAGASWARIGAVYGLTKQGAQQRFKRPAEPAPTTPSAGDRDDS
ncbi:hypothetical protein ACQB6R_11580 [Propionibacteriaceae bacterium G1746]|uniref:hypothetical protein n=1 Tax=Aestuariimicrobium sp. G57 TaxID=3418485 RepID=UPI003C26DA2F